MIRMTRHEALETTNNANASFPFSFDMANSMLSDINGGQSVLTA
jgi:hypothetical protein